MIFSTPLLRTCWLMVALWLLSSCTVISRKDEPAEGAEDVADVSGASDIETEEILEGDAELDIDVGDDPGDVFDGDVPADVDDDALSDADPEPDGGQGPDGEDPTDAESDDGQTVDGGGCQPNCTGKVCGSDGCGGLCGGADTANGCPPETPVCKQGQCEEEFGCTPDCEGKLCGSDGCGGSCGDCLFPSDLSTDQEAYVVELRQATELGFQKGRTQFEVELNTRLVELADLGLITMGAYFGLSPGATLFGSALVPNEDYEVFPCKFLTNGFDEPPATCGTIVLFAKNETFKSLTTLTAKSELPDDIEFGENSSEAHNALTLGFGAGVREAVEFHRWALREQGICDTFTEPATGKENPLPVVEAYWKGIAVGMQYFSEVLNEWIGAYGYDTASWPDDLSPIDLCNLNDLLLKQAREEAEAGYATEAVDSPLCSEGYTPPQNPGVPEGYASMEEAYLGGVKDGYEAEFTISANALWESLGCIPTVLTY